MELKERDGEIMIVYIREFHLTPDKAFGIEQTDDSIILFETKMYFNKWNTLTFIKKQTSPSEPLLQKKYKKKYNRNKNHYTNLQKSYGTKSTRW